MRYYCGLISEKLIGEEITLFGWVQKNREMGQVSFIDLRDREGIAQIVCQNLTEHIRSEYVLRVTGTVRARSNPNPNIPTGNVEVEAKNIEVLSKSLTPPFEVEDDTKTAEITRLEYRYLDLRRPRLQSFIKLRHKAAMAIRKFYDAEGFFEIETPVLTASTPEGARDYLVPSRLHPGKFYALPQSPQQYKQLLMVSGFDRYFQIARCFRDEDLRADRQPDFTQIDMEMSFVGMDDVLEINERMIKTLFSEVLGVEIPLPIKRLPYRDAIEKYGTDKPDLRYGLEIEPFEVEGFFARKITVGDENILPRKQLDALNAFVKGQCGIGFRSAKRDGKLEITAADKNPALVYKTLGIARVEIAKLLGLCDPKKFEFVWITEFPLFEWSEEENRYVSQHHPFTSPMPEDVRFLDEGKLDQVRGVCYDMVLNGYELCSGSIRIHDSALQEKMFGILQLPPEEIESRFGHLIRAFKYGVPPHGGIGFGLDRIIMLMCGTDNIRDVIAFPKTQQAVDMMMRAPADVARKQLDELGLTVK